MITIKPKTVHRHSPNKVTLEGETGVLVRIETRRPKSLNEGASWKEIAEAIGCEYNRTAPSPGHENVHLDVWSVELLEERSGNRLQLERAGDSSPVYIHVLSTSKKTWRQVDETGL